MENHHDSDKNSDSFSRSIINGTKGKGLGEEGECSVGSNDPSNIEELEKRSFFYQRMREMREKQEKVNKTEENAVPVEERKEMEEIEHRAAVVPKKEPIEHNTIRVDTESNYIDETGWLPSDPSEIDDKTWRDMPAEIQWELRQHFKRCGNGGPGKTGRGKGNGQNQRRRGKKKTEEIGKCANGQSSSKTITDYFDHI